MIKKCELCGSDMRIGSKLKSGNSVYVEWLCTKCLNKKLECEGIAGK